MYNSEGTGYGNKQSEFYESKIRFASVDISADLITIISKLLRGGCSGLAVVSHVRLDECVGGDCVMGR